MIRKIREITSKDENFRLEKVAPGISVVKRDHIQVVQVGDYIANVYRITAVGRDCDGSALYEMAGVDRNGEETGVILHSASVYPETDVQLDHPNDLFEVAEKSLSTYMPPCTNCGHSPNWHRISSEAEVQDPTDKHVQFRCIGYDCESDGPVPPGGRACECSNYERF